jgi:polysaccharide biosynthesis/export protein
MKNLCATRELTSPKSLTGAVMKHGANRALSTCLFLVLAFCGTSKGQGPAKQPDSKAPIVTAPAAPAQPQAPSADSQTNASYKIGTDDVLTISVWNEPNLSRSIPVRSDGKISLPLVGELQAAGRTPPQLEQEISAGLRSYITDPQVTVIVQQINSEKFNILGQVIKAGEYPLAAGTTIVDAIATAGGFKYFARRKAVYVLRKNAAGEDVRIPFNYDQFIKGKNTNQNILLKPHDTVVVP